MAKSKTNNAIKQAGTPMPKRSTPVDRKALAAKVAAKPAVKKVRDAFKPAAKKPAAALKSKTELANTFGTRLAEAMTSKPAVKKPAVKKTAPTVLRYKGFKIPLVQAGKDDTDVEIPTITIKTTAELVKLFEKLPKGCHWGSDASVDSMNIYNGKGQLIAELRAVAK